ncbi:hypothetical protein ACFPM0_14340 [Pseudonocardia sulfidoxydans]|uniref:hypothetical protein n=1 Tax=Pseudonocardia sulfidoxydans TaxID=54011 RepID=UPI00361147A0
MEQPRQRVLRAPLTVGPGRPGPPRRSGHARRLAPRPSTPARPRRTGTRSATVRP